MPTRFGNPFRSFYGWVVIGSLRLMDSVEPRLICLRILGASSIQKQLLGSHHRYSPIGSPLTVDELDATEAVQRLRRLGFNVVAFSRLWWVNQGKTYDAELAEGIVWAPTQSKSGVQLEHHKAVMQLRPGDMIVHYSKGVRAVSFVASEPLNAPKPASISSDEWQTAGFLCRTDYQTLPEPIPIEEIPNRNLTLAHSIAMAR